jgi:hypothetical protein
MSNLTAMCGYTNSTGMMRSNGGAMHQCICNNMSFNVSSLAGLCMSCVQEHSENSGMGGGMGMEMMGDMDGTSPQI